jgi:hypothetical protein
MSMDADLALQRAIYARLAADENLAALIGARLYDNVPGDTGFPYVTLGEALVGDNGTGDSEGAEHRLAFNVYSRGGGRSEAKAIMGALDAALRDAALTLDGFTLVNLRFLDAETRREPDGATWRGTIRFRAATEPSQER